MKWIECLVYLKDKPLSHCGTSIKASSYRVDHLTKSFANIFFKFQTIGTSFSPLEFVSLNSLDIIFRPFFRLSTAYSMVEMEKWDKNQMESTRSHRETFDSNSMYNSNPSNPSMDFTHLDTNILGEMNSNLQKSSFLWKIQLKSCKWTKIFILSVQSKPKMVLKHGWSMIPSLRSPALQTRRIRSMERCHLLQLGSVWWAVTALRMFWTMHRRGRILI